jgi:hypothetical protein
MKARRIFILLLLPLLLAAKSDPYEKVAPADRVSVETGLQRYVKDQIGRKWADLYEIAVPGYAVQGDYDDPTGKREPFLSKDAFVHAERDKLADGILPLMTSFKLVSIAPVEGGYEVRGCSKSKRESFNFKGIVRFAAYVVKGQIRFGAWSFVYAMPHSCTQTEDGY